MKTILFMRHAKSGWNNAHLSDHDRPLTPRGEAAAPVMGTLLKEKGLVPDTMLCSTANRAHTTAVLVAEACGYDKTIDVIAELYHGSPMEYLRYLAQVETTSDRAMLVGHNPGLEDVIFMLTGQVVEMPTAAIAHIEVPIDEWAELTSQSQGVLLDSWRPREIEGEGDAEA